MIEECNFKDKLIQYDEPTYDCVISKYLCCGEDNCILYQIYKQQNRKKQYHMINNVKVRGED